MKKRNIDSKIKLITTATVIFESIGDDDDKILGEVGLERICEVYFQPRVIHSFNQNIIEKFILSLYKYVKIN